MFEQKNGKYGELYFDVVLIQKIILMI